MNAGFHDAVGLTWRLAMTLAGYAAPVVLGSYDGELRGEHARLDDQQAKGFRRVVYRGPTTDLALNVGTKLLPNIGSFIQGTDDLQQLSVNYPKSSLNEDHLGQPLLHARVRAPDAEVTDGDGNTTTLFSAIYNSDGQTWGWCLLAFDGGEEDGNNRLPAALAGVAAWDWVHPHLVLVAPGAAKADLEASTGLSDLDGRAHAAYGLDSHPALVLIRPDGHIAFRGSLDRPELLSAYCEKVLGAPSTSRVANG